MLLSFIKSTANTQKGSNKFKNNQLKKEQETLFSVYENCFLHHIKLVLSSASQILFLEANMFTEM